MDVHLLENMYFEKYTCNLVIRVKFVLEVDVLSVSMRFNVNISIYEHI